MDLFDIDNNGSLSQIHFNRMVQHLQWLTTQTRKYKHSTIAGRDNQYTARFAICTRLLLAFEQVGSGGDIPDIGTCTDVALQ
jgi:hypothetical protein